MEPKYYSIPLKLRDYDSDLNVVGIDLGTTECCAAVIRKNGPDFVVLDEIRNNSREMPSYIAFDEVKPKCGQIVVDRMRYKAEYSVYDSKRILGKKYEEIVKDPLWPFQVISTPENGIQIEVETLNGKELKSCEEITANLLTHIKETVEKYQGKMISEAVITIPSGFSHNQKAATMNAAKMAGFQKISFLPEPIAAAFAYFVEINIPENSNILICDCGGGTVDICIVKVLNNERLQVSNFDGDSLLGGRDFDNILFNHFAAILKHKYGFDVTKTNKKFVLRQKCQNIKHTLSAHNEDSLDVSDFIVDSNEFIQISRTEFEEMTANLLLKIQNAILRVVSNSTLLRSEIHYVFQVGGGCRMPMIKKMLKDIFPESDHRCNLYPDWVVGHGAALYAYYLSQDGEDSKQVQIISKEKPELQTKSIPVNLHYESNNRKTKSQPFFQTIFEGFQKALQ